MEVERMLAGRLTATTRTLISTLEVALGFSVGVNWLKCRHEGGIGHDDKDIVYGMTLLQYYIA